MRFHQSKRSDEYTTSRTKEYEATMTIAGYGTDLRGHGLKVDLVVPERGDAYSIRMSLQEAGALIARLEAAVCAATGLKTT